MRASTRPYQEQAGLGRGLVYLLHLVWVFGRQVLLSRSFRLVSLLTPQLVVLLWLGPNRFKWKWIPLTLYVCCFLTSMAFLYKETFFLWIFSMMLWNYEREQRETGRPLRDRSSFCISLKVSPEQSTVCKRSWMIMSYDLNFFFLLTKCLNKLYCQKHSLFCLCKHMNLCDIPFLIHKVSCDVGPPFAAITASSLAGRISTRFRSMFIGIFDCYWWPRSRGFRSLLQFPPTVVCRVDMGTQAKRVLLRQTASSTPLWTCLCAPVCSRVGPGRGHPQTAPANVGACKCPSCPGVLKQGEFLSPRWPHSWILRRPPLPGCRFQPLPLCSNSTKSWRQLWNI